MNKASKEMGESIVTKSGHIVHEKCPSTQKSNYNKRSKEKTFYTVNEPPLLRSKNNFTLKKTAFFVELLSLKILLKETFDVHAVECRTTEFQKTVEQIHNERNDEWAIEIKVRIEFARHLHAADAVYHKACSKNIHTKAFHRCFHQRRRIKISVVE